MSFLTGLHGTFATLLICAFLFADETGVPLPFAPNELLLVLAGLLIASGALSPFEFYPVAVFVLAAGSFAGYGWAYGIGADRLRGVAARLHFTSGYDRAVRLIRSGTWLPLFLARLVPAVRTPATLAAGAARIDARLFAVANIPALLIWLAVWTTLGYFVGLPIEHVISRAQDFALSGALFVILGFAAFRVARRAPAMRQADPEHLSSLAPRYRRWLALGVDLTIVATFVAGLERLARFGLDVIDEHPRIQLFPEGPYELILLLVAIGLTYIIVSRRTGRGETAGERLFSTSYGRSRAPSSRTSATTHST